MKNSKKLKLILMVLICILIMLVGFCGIYKRYSNSNIFENLIPEYELASDLKGERVLEFEVDDSSETIYLDKDGNEVDSTEITEENEKDYTKEERLINKEENLNVDNYKKVVKIMKQRLEFLQADQYRIDLDEKTGKIILTFEDDYPEDIKSILPMEGKLELIDSNTEDSILTYSDFSKAEATYAALDDGSYEAYINLKLNNSGIEKINNIDNYKTATNKETEETTANKFKVMFDNDEIAEVSYDDILLIDKTLRITTETNLTSNSTINSELNTNTIVSKLSTMGKLPVIYNVVAEEYIKSDVANYIEYIVMGIGIICVAISIYFVIKYRLKGMLAVISFATSVALVLILIRLTNIEVSLNSFAGILGLIVLNTILVKNILECTKNKDTKFSESIKKAYLKTLDAFVIVLIIFVVFAFSSMTVINVTGLLVFWGWIVILLGNLILTVPILAVANNK